jgi:uncharacterized protein YjbI with pentapeptide repeats
VAQYSLSDLESLIAQARERGETPTFRAADLSNMGLFMADLKGVDFSGSNLRQANMTRANLQKAVLRNATLNEATLSGGRPGRC